jgi:hypothetical protein
MLTTEGLAAADMRKAAINPLSAARMVTEGRDAVANVPLPLLIEADCPTHVPSPALRRVMRADDAQSLQHGDLNSSAVGDDLDTGRVPLRLNHKPSLGMIAS